MRKRSTFLKIGIGTTLLILLYIVYHSVSNSLFSNPLSRINIGIWGKHAYVLSLSAKTNQHIIFVFPNSHIVQVPGGLKGYKIGALGKLAQLENDPFLFTKALGQGSGLFIHKALHMDSDRVYYDDDKTLTNDLNSVVGEIKNSVFLDGDLSIVDRIYLYLTISNAKASQITLINVGTNAKQEVLFDRIFRNEKKLVQIVYNLSQRTAYFLSTNLENTGIRVADVSAGDTATNECTVKEPTSKHSETAKFISKYFDCKLITGDTGLYEIIWRLDTKVEDKWKL